ncbi:MAG: CDP-alcohol phosphatidyltransferase family protein [Anaerolineales bacterium]|jgi:archaetidylinositol phosphate synthase
MKQQLTDIQQHKRVNDILLGPLERPALKWLAEHMPARVSPDMLTATGVLGALVIFISYYLTNFNPNFLWLASLGFVINWFGDSLDGTVARVRNAQRPRYGFFIDHTVDSLNEVLIFLGLGVSPYIRFDIACLALVGYLLMSVLIYVRTCVDGEFKISYAKIGPTEFRVIAILSNAVVFFNGNPSYRFGEISLTVYDLIGIVIALLLMGAFIFSILIQAREYKDIDIDKEHLKGKSKG